eukprot:9583393-Lingulodinium_polyedra.AAC.1
MHRARVLFRRMGIGGQMFNPELSGKRANLIQAVAMATDDQKSAMLRTPSVCERQRCKPTLTAHHWFN